MGAYLGYQLDPIKFPLETDTMPRPVAEQPWFLGFAPTVPLS